MFPVAKSHDVSPRTKSTTVVNSNVGTHRGRRCSFSSQAVQSDGGALGEAVGPQGNSPKSIQGPQGDSLSGLHEGKGEVGG